MNPYVTNESLKACYRVADQKSKELLISPRARVKMSGEFICCVQCYKSLKTENLEKIYQSLLFKIILQLDIYLKY
jgi:hypothetical protein